MPKDSKGHGSNGKGGSRRFSDPDPITARWQAEIAADRAAGKKPAGGGREHPAVTKARADAVADRAHRASKVTVTSNKGKRTP